MSQSDTKAWSNNERVSSSPLSEQALSQLFTGARTFHRWLDKPVSEDILLRIVDLAKMGPTSLNASPMRLIFARSATAKARIRPALLPGNIDKTMAAPITVIVGYDLEFHRHLDVLWPLDPTLKSMFAANEILAEETAIRNGTLQSGYLILAARALGLDCGPMSGFDRSKVDAEFFSGTAVRTNFLCNLGYGDACELRPRLPRLISKQIVEWA